MRRKLAVAALPWLTFALAAVAQEPGERWNYPFEAQGWKRVPAALDAPLGERVYVRAGENAYFWSERIVSGHRSAGSSPDDYVAGFLEDLAENCRPIKVSPMDEQPVSVILQWDGDCRIIGPLFEYRRVVVAKDGVHYFAYAAKPNRLTPAKKEAWLEIVRGTALK